MSRCHKCGWPYPNPHPSAKQRRSHKKACGILEGYKLLPSSIASDDIGGNRSDEDHKVAGEIKRNPLFFYGSHAFNSFSFWNVGTWEFILLTMLKKESSLL